jgi:arsenate reductase (thioredoxin)
MGVVLFVCVENTFRSVLSEALFNASPPPGWKAESAGVQAAAAINPVVVDLLQEIGIRLGPKTPRIVTPETIARASRVITFGCLDRCPIGAKDKAEDWPLPGATGKSMDELRAIRDELRRRIADLGSRVSTTEPSTPKRMRKA